MPELFEQDGLTPEQKAAFFPEEEDAPEAATEEQLSSAIDERLKREGAPEREPVEVETVEVDASTKEGPATATAIVPRATLTAAAGQRVQPLRPDSVEGYFRLAQYVASSDLVPSSYKNKPANVLVAMQFGAELGLSPMQAVQNIAVIGGRPAVWGDAVIAIVFGHPLFVQEAFSETTEGEYPSDDFAAVCTCQREGSEPKTTRFSIADAKTAGLWGGRGPWSQYPKRMLKMRARGFALRDSFPDSLKGMYLAEEVVTVQQEPYTSGAATKSDKVAALLGGA